jgi:drug/metabolite transporter (DMT)-like permease
MLIGAFFFAMMSLLTESLSREYSFAWIACIRSLIATAVAVAMAWAGGVRLAFWRPKTLWLRSLAGCISMMFLFFAMTHYDVSVILSLSSTYPLWVAVFSWPMLGHFPSRDTWWALLASTLGMCLVYLAADTATAAIDSAYRRPDLAIPSGILAGLFSAVALIGLHKVKQVDPRAVVAHFSAVSTVIAGLIWLMLPAATDGPVRLAGSAAWLRLAGVGVTAVLGQLFLTKAFAAGTPSRVSVIGLSQVAFAALYQWLAEGRLPTRQSLAGMLLVIGATCWVMLNKSPEPTRLEEVDEARETSG